MGMSADQISRLGPSARRQIELMKLEEARKEALTMQAPAPRQPAKPSSKASKYGNVPTTLHGHKFASQAEGRHYLRLRAAEQRGEITGLILHPRYRLELGGMTVCFYVADFEYRNAAGELVIEDVKGVLTPAFVLKRKLMKALLGLDVTVIKEGDKGYD